MRLFYKICISIVVLAVPMSAAAATLRLVAEPAAPGVGDSMAVSVYVDTDVPVNTFSGTLVAPASLVPTAVLDGNSVINMWLTRPSAGSLTFAGVTPGGYRGQGGLLFKVLFTATRAGTADITLHDVELLRNDGQGGREAYMAEPLSLTIASEPRGSYVEAPDTQAPEPFVPDVTVLDEGQYVVFAASDKGSGIDHYEVAERRVPFMSLQWQAVDSPYRLHDQYRISTVYVKAVDRAGNEQVAVVPRAHWLTPLEWAVGCMLILVLAALGIWYRRRSHRYA